MKIAGIRNHFANWRDWELNPIVVKELRQAVRSWAVTGMLLLFLIILFIASLGFLVTQSFDVNPNLGLGRDMFSTFTVILAAASIFFIPFYLGVRVAAERQENNPDLLYATTLSPARIIRGKFLCGAYMALLFFSAVMPFMAFTNLLRGVDLPTIFFILFFLFLIVCVANMVAIFLACLPLSRPFKILFALYGGFQGFGLIIPAIAFSFGFMRSGVGAMIAERHFWNGALTVIAICAAVAGLFFILATALISPQSANRALPVRAYITTIWIIGGLLSLVWAVSSGSEPVIVWARLSFILMILSMLVVVSNSDEISVRVRRTIPQNRLKRFFAFLIFNGAAGGLIWIALISIATVFAGRELVSLGFGTSGMVHSHSRPLSLGNLFMSGTSGSVENSYFVNWATIMAYAFDYALLALFIHRKFFPKRAPKLAGLFTVLLAALWALLPSVILFFLNELSWKSVEGLQLGNLFNVFGLRDDSRRIYHFYFAFGWLALMLLLNTTWFARQIKNFRPLEKIEPPPVIVEIPPPIAK